jgi:ribonuclease HII
LCVNFEIEKELFKKGYRIIAGVDEVGRGALCGPVVAAAVILDKNKPFIEGVKDSKQIAPEKRKKLAKLIFKRAKGVGIGIASKMEIDANNIFIATNMAIKRAIKNLPIEPDFLLVDGRPLKNCYYPQRGIVSGDKKCLSIASASIVAKVIRDEMMIIYDQFIPGYSWNKNKGYGTKEHFIALNELGPSLLHRITFNIIK